MKKGTFKTILISIFMVMLAISPSAIMAQTKTINLKFAGWLPPRTTYAVPADHWGKLVEERTKGAVKFTAYHAESLGKYTEFPKLMKSGLCEMAIVAGGTPGFELLGLADLPAYVIPVRNSMDLLHAIYRKGFFSSMFEEKGMKLMFFMNSDPRLIWFRNKKVTKLSEFRGLKVRGTTLPTVEVARALGATAVQVSPADLYTATERGTIDGMLTVTEGIYALKVAELLKYVLWEPVACDNMAVVMDLKVWNSLPPEIRATIQEINEEMKYWYVETVKTDQENQERVRKAGIEIYRFDPGEKAALQAAIDPVTQNWVERMEGKGIPAKKVDNEMRRILKQY